MATSRQTTQVPTRQKDRFTLDHQGRRLQVATGRDGIATTARLFVDGDAVAEGKNWWEPVTITYGSLTVRVRSNLIAQVLGCALVVDPKTNDGDPAFPFTPPPGSRAAKLDDLARRHPTLYASRHVGIALLQLAIGLFGIGALIRGLLPRLGIDIPFPDLDLSPPGWLRTILDVPDRVLEFLFGWIDFPSLDGMIDAIAPYRIWIPVVIAIFVAIEEVERRRKRTRAGSDRDEPHQDA